MWDKSVGSLGSSKLGLLVKKKGGGLVKPKETAKKEDAAFVKPVAVKKPEVSKEAVQKPTGPSGLGLLGAYSDSDSTSD